MKTDPRTPQLLTLSERVYRALLVLYPADFRREYGQYMTQVFRDVCRDAYRQGGAGGLANWWVTALFDLLQTVITQWRKVDYTVSQSRFIQWSGWLCMLGGLFFAASSLSQLQPSLDFMFGRVYQLSLYALVPGMTLIMLGLLGMFLRYNPHIALFGKLALLTALIGAGLASLGWLLTLLIGGDFYRVFMLGFLVYLIGHSVFGGFATTTRLLPKWNFALLIGSGLPLTVAVMGFAQQGASYGTNWGGFIMLVLIGVGWLWTGWALNSQPNTGLQVVSAA